MGVVNSKQEHGRQSPRRMALLSQLSDPILLKRARDGDVGAFEELVGRTEVKLYRLVMRIVHNESDAQEILQDSYLSAWRSMSTFEGTGAIRFMDAQNRGQRGAGRLRTRNRHPEVAIHDLDPSEWKEAIGQSRRASLWGENLPDRPDEQLQSAERLRTIETAVNLLPHHLRAIFLLRAVGEVSTEDSAARLGVSIPTAKTRLQRARRVLRESLS
jgi:RNA polymerase sigma-70 factor (ECF subfamily)